MGGDSVSDTVSSVGEDSVLGKHSSNPIRWGQEVNSEQVLRAH